MKTTFKLILFVLWSLTMAASAYAVETTPDPLTPEAQAAINKGIIAAKVPDYLLAIRFFEAARKLAPEAPVIYLNLGLAESKIPGRELRAIAWFGAYLAAYPDAPNAVAVKEQIDMLEVRNQSNVSRLIKTVQDTADQITGVYHVQNLLKVVRLWLGMNDITEALRTAKLMVHSIKDRDETVFNTPTSEGLSKSDQEKRHVVTYRDYALRDIAYAQTTKGEIKNALKTIDLMTYSSTKAGALAHIADEEITAGDISGARKTLLSALKIADRIDKEAGAGILTPESIKSQSLAYIAKIKAKADITNAPSSHQITSAPQPPILPLITADDWLKKLDDDNEGNPCPLSTEPFLDLAGHLNSLPSPSEDLHAHAWALLRTAEKIVSARNVIIGMLKQEVKK
jgi:tetratricopeptide (TPR) repeat protein